MHIILVHGWGYGPDIWSPLLSKLDYSIKTTCVDLGFFHQEGNAEALPENAYYIGHSLGVLWILKNAPSSVKGFISIAGFNRFAPFIDARTIKTMQIGVKRNTVRQLQAFWNQCNTPDYNLPNTPDETVLTKGLEWLADWNAEDRYKQLTCNKLFLAAKDDLIVPKDMTEQNWPNEHIEWTDTGGHALPLTRPDWIYNHINRFLDATG